MILNKERQGETFIFAGAVLWGLFPVITVLSYNQLSPLLSLGGSTLFSSIFFALLLSLKKQWHQIKNLSALKYILLVTLFSGILYYLFYFFALRYANAGNVSIIALTEIFFSYLLFHFFKKDPLPIWHISGAILMIIGAIIVIYPNIKEFRGGEVLMLMGATIAPFGNFFQQKARKMVSSEMIMFIRSLLTTMFVLLTAFVLKNSFSVPNLRDSLTFLIINGVFLLGFSKIMWIEGIHRISVTKSNALSSISPLLTLFFAWILLQHPPTFWQLFSFIPMFFGVIFLGITKKS
ncbi:DMT family transporter [Candidatus Daviesbacteria bacterium]|nr:DMT family transporter [Candidatus Daviesbacteria bacterium]